MADRCPHSPLETTGWLTGWRLTFGGEGWDGALPTLVEDPAGKVFVAGADADRRNIRWVAQGVQAVDVWKEIKPLADQAAAAALALARAGGKPAAALFPNARMLANGTTQIPTIVTPVALVTKDNIDTTVIAGGHLTHDQVYGPNTGG